MESKSLQLNDETWTVFELGERALLLEPTRDVIELPLIHKTAGILESAHIAGVIDIIPAYESIALIYNRELGRPEVEIKAIEKFTKDKTVSASAPRKITVPVCYERGLDWEEVEKYTGLAKKDIIQKHAAGKYTVAMMGFLPGFLYLSGLEKAIACPRKENPRTNIPAGSVGIGGEQTGLYSLESPGGWQIIGRTPYSFFDVHANPPTRVDPGDIIVFTRISEKEFEEAES